MKHATKLVVSSSLVCALIVASLLLAGGCSREKREAPAVVSAERNSFNEVTARLDRGGSLFVYLGTEQWLTGLHERVSVLRDLVLADANMGERERKNAQKGFDVAARLVQRIGVESISGVGLSRVALEPGFYRTKGFVHHYSDQGAGWLWNWLGRKSHPLGGLDCLPVNTAWATFFDLDLAAAWTAILQELHETGNAEAEAAMQKVSNDTERQGGQKLETILGSLAGEFGMVLTLDFANKITVPMGRSPMEIPQPGLAIVTKVKDDTLFNAVDRQLKQNPMVTASEKDGVRMRSFSVPALAMFKIQPVLARTGDWLVLASSDELLWQMLDAKAGKKPGLKSTDEFKKLARELAAAQGNQFSYVSKRFGEIVMEIQKATSAAKPAGAKSQFALLQKLLNTQPVTSFAVSSNTGDGWFSVAHSQ
ncbi:MAG: hypothetical protein NTY01_03995 [Verrucomicrobia bacterium]|nr:hypothetical protein [Verrucomicrobiota bacterium]